MFANWDYVDANGNLVSSADAMNPWTNNSVLGVDNRSISDLLAQIPAGQDGTITFRLSVGNLIGNSGKWAITSQFDYNLAVKGTNPNPVTVTSVAVTPASVSVAKGATQKFTAVVNGTNNPPQTVTWSLCTCATSANTKIDPVTGVLTIGSDEKTTLLTVYATSTYNTGVYGTAAVTVIPPVPSTDITFVDGAPVQDINGAKYLIINVGGDPLNYIKNPASDLNVPSPIVTGSVITLKADSTKFVTVVVRNDLNGDGKADFYDLVALSSAIDLNNLNQARRV
jgi:hypothetical protein